MPIQEIVFDFSSLRLFRVAFLTELHFSNSNLVSCFQEELSRALATLTNQSVADPTEATAPTLQALAAAMVLLRRCRVNAALTIQLFSHLFHYINAVCFNKVRPNRKWHFFDTTAMMLLLATAMVLLRRCRVNAALTICLLMPSASIR